MNLIVIDIVLNLTEFRGLPHFCCDVVTDANIGIKAIMKLKKEMDRRFTIRAEDIAEFNKLPIIVCVIDELVSFVSRAGSKETMKSLADILSLLIRTGRHAKIYMVLTTQNPVVDDLKCDISSITSRLAFAVAKPINSVTILGEGGAEELSEAGEMYFISAKHKGLEYLKGARIKKDEVEAVCNHVRTKYEDMQWDDTYKFTIDANAIVENMENSPFVGSITTAQEIEDVLFAKIILWTLERETVSANAIKLAFKDDKIGERQAKRFVERLHSLGIVGEAIEKLPRKVLITSVEDLPDEAKGFLDRHSYSTETNELQESLQAEGLFDAEQIAVSTTEVKTAISKICPTCGQSIIWEFTPYNQQPYA